jgi:hypothetical protein
MTVEMGVKDAIETDPRGFACRIDSFKPTRISLE